MHAAACGPGARACYRRAMLNKVQAGLAIACAVLLAGCRAQPAVEDEPANGANEAVPSPARAIVEAPFDRSRLLLTVARAASAQAMGADDAGVQRALDGKRFEVRLRFGCDGQGPGRGDHGWSIDPDGRTLRLRVVPTLSLKDELVKGVAGEQVEAVEGFWLPRPWLLQPACPALGPVEQPAAEPEQAEPEPTTPAQRIGIAQFFTATDSRTRRRIDRPFEAVKKLNEGERAGGDGFNLVLSGRLRARGNGRVILCQGAGRDRAPDCIVSADVDRVWIEQPGDKSVMAEWSM